MHAPRPAAVALTFCDTSGFGDFDFGARAATAATFDHDSALTHLPHRQACPHMRNLCVHRATAWAKPRGEISETRHTRLKRPT
ncbi:hypothetical protein BLA50215_02057 [Burkholderia lata]|nr:hypothetical protein BLA50215_02057 [Burkholderia lata]